MALWIFSIIVLRLSMELIICLVSGDFSEKNKTIIGLVLYILGFCKKRIRIVFPVFLTLITAFLVFFLRVLPSRGLQFNEINNSINYLSMSKELFYMQSSANCAPYSVMAVVNVLKGIKVDPEKLARETRWRINKNMTFPQGLIDLLRTNKINTREYSLKTYTNKEKIIWLKNQIDSGNPVILLVKVKTIQHYLTIIGYDKHGFMMYDSSQKQRDENTGLTVVDKEGYAGNRYYTNLEVIQFWNNGGYTLFFKNWAVVCYAG